MCWGVGEEGEMWEEEKRRCRKVCWGVGEVRGDVGKGEGNEVRKIWGVWEEVCWGPTP